MPKRCGVIRVSESPLEGQGQDELHGILSFSWRSPDGRTASRGRRMHGFIPARGQGTNICAPGQDDRTSAADAPPCYGNHQEGQVQTHLNMSWLTSSPALLQAQMPRR